MVEEDIINDIEYAQKFLLESDSSIIAIKHQKKMGERKGFGLRPFLEIIDELGTELSECVIGDRILGRASALLCRYTNVRGVYSPQGTKTAIAILLMGGIVVQMDSIIPLIKNKTGDDVCPFERLLKDVEDPYKAYNLLYEKIMNQYE